MIRNILGILLIIIGILLGLYLGIWVLFIGGIVGIAQFIADIVLGLNLDYLLLSLSILKFMFAGVVGWITVIVVGFIGSLVAKW